MYSTHTHLLNILFKRFVSNVKIKCRGWIRIRWREKKSLHPQQNEKRGWRLGEDVPLCKHSVSIITQSQVDLCKALHLVATMECCATAEKGRLLFIRIHTHTRASGKQVFECEGKPANYFTTPLDTESPFSAHLHRGALAIVFVSTVACSVQGVLNTGSYHTALIGWSFPMSRQHRHNTLKFDRVIN